MTKNVLSIGHSIYDFGFLLNFNCSVSVSAHEIKPCEVSCDVVTMNFEDLNKIVFVDGMKIRERFDFSLNFVLMRNCFTAFLQYWYNIYNACSATPLFSEGLLTSFLCFFSLIPIFSLSLFNEKKKNEEFLELPEYYKASNNVEVYKKDLIIKILSCCISSFCFLKLSNLILSKSQEFSTTISLNVYSYTLSICLMSFCIGSVIASTHIWSGIHLFLILSSFVLFVTFFMIKTSKESVGREFNALFAAFSSPIILLFVFFSLILSLFVQDSYNLIFSLFSSPLKKEEDSEQDILSSRLRNDSVSIFDNVDDDSIDEEV